MKRNKHALREQAGSRSGKVAVCWYELPYDIST